LLGDLSSGLRAFWQEITRQGNGRRVCLLVFSEFGRRVAENSGQGTDHGAAAPVFVLGAGIRAGFHGQFPSLAPGDLLKGDVRHTTDFRQIYAALLKRHLAVDPEPLLGKAHAPLDLWA
jgi:uncharacterized protein (DUF1501 family)